MAKFLIFSDAHVHPWSAFATVTKRGINSRLSNLLKTLKDMLALGERESCDAVLFSGDLFHVPKIAVETYDLTARIVKESKLPVVMIPGNHDEASKMASFHSMRALKGERTYVLDEREGRQVTIAGRRIGGVPFVPDPRLLLHRLADLRRCDVVLCHTGFAGARAGFDYIADQKNFVQVPDLKLEETEIELLVAGHFHQPQVYLKGDECFAAVKSFGWKKVEPGFLLIPGAPVQHTFGDSESVRGCWTFDADTRGLEFHPLEYPKFVKTVWPFKGREVEGNYVSCTVRDSKEVDAARVVLSLLAKGFTIRLETPEREEAKRSRISLEAKTSKVLREYVAKHPPDEEDRKLVGVGMSLLAKAEKESGE